MQFYFTLQSIVWILITINGLEANIETTNNNNSIDSDIKRPNYRLIYDLLFGTNNQHLRQDPNYFRTILNRYDNNPRLNNNFDGNNHHSNTGHSSFGNKRFVPNQGLPIGGYPPNNMWSNGQNGLRFEYPMNNQFMNMPMNNQFNPMNHQFYGSNPMAGQLMPQTFNFMNTLRAGLKTGIPSYGFGYGIISDGFMNNGFAMNNGFPFNPPFRTGSSDLENDERLSNSEPNVSTNKLNQRKN